MKISEGKLNLAYMAGILDGEGCIMIAKRHDKMMKSPRYYLRVVVAMANPYIAELFRFNFGGNMQCRRIKPEFRIIHQWQLCDGGASKFLKIILPYLRLKRNEAELGIKFQERKSNPTRVGNCQLSESELVLREADRILMKKLKDKSVV